MRFNYYFEKWYKQFISLKGPPRTIAMGLAIGVFIGVTPTIPFHTVLVIVLCFLLKQNLTAGYLGVWIVSNPLTVPFLYFSQYRLGKFILGDSFVKFLPPDYSLISILKHGGNMVIPLLTGGIIMAPFVAVPVYFLAHRAILAIRSKPPHDQENT